MSYLGHFTLDAGHLLKANLMDIYGCHVGGCVDPVSKTHLSYHYHKYELTAF